MGTGHGRLRPRPVGVMELLALVALLGIPLVVDDVFTLDRLGRFAMLALLAVAVDVLWGLGGLVSFGHAIFFGCAGYAVAIVDQRWVDGPLSLPTAVLIGTGASVLLGLALSLFAFSRRGSLGGIYFALVTLILAVVAERLAATSHGITGGKNGLGLDVRMELAGRSYAFGPDFYQLAVGVLVVMYVAVRLYMRSRHGRELLALRENEHRLALLGYHTARLKTQAVLVSAAVAGVGGSIYYAHDGIISPGSLGLSPSILALLWVLVGGVGTLLGPLVGAIVLNLFTAELSGRYLESWQLLLGLVLVGTLLFASRGLFGSIRRPEDRLRRQLA